MDLKTIGNLLTHGIFTIPDYQRGYSWGTNQLEEFWDDLVDVEHVSEHYTGTITLIKKEKHDIENGDDIIGYCISLFAVDECQLLNITVKSDFQKKGFGELMLKNIFNECKKENIINIFLEVRRSNSSAIRLYEKNGFNEIGVRNNYYQLRDGQEDAILMGLAI